MHIHIQHQCPRRHVCVRVPIYDINMHMMSTCIFTYSISAHADMHVDIQELACWTSWASGG